VLLRYNFWQALRGAEAAGGVFCNLLYLFIKMAIQSFILAESVIEIHRPQRGQGHDLSCGSNSPKCVDQLSLVAHVGLRFYSVFVA
jgi:hypothetical protein